MTKKQQHNIRNAIVCLHHAIKTKDWSVVDIQVRRIDEAIKPSENNTINVVIQELKRIRNENDLNSIHKYVDDLICFIENIFYV